MTSNLATRLLTVAVGAPLLLLLLFGGSPTAWFGLVCLAAALGGWELLGMTHRGDLVSQAVGGLLSAGTCATVYLGRDDPRLLLSVVLVLPVAGMMLTLWRLGQVEGSALRAMTAVAGPLYVGGLLAALALLRRYGSFYVLLALKLSWFADTGAYFVGRRWGHLAGKLHRRVSPQKTQIGFAGSLLGAMLGAAVAHFWYLGQLPLVELLGLAVVAGALGQLGDLAESLLKRSTGVKDSGSLIPGHGGLLDRIDALLIVSPVLYLYVLWRVGGQP